MSLPEIRDSGRAGFVEKVPSSFFLVRGGMKQKFPSHSFEARILKPKWQQGHASCEICRGGSFLASSGSWWVLASFLASSGSLIVGASLQSLPELSHGLFFSCVPVSVSHLFL